MKFLHVMQTCRICTTPARLESCKTDEQGRAVHEDCYVEKIALTADLFARAGCRYYPRPSAPEWNSVSDRGPEGLYASRPVVSSGLHRYTAWRSGRSEDPCRDMGIVYCRFSFSGLQIGQVCQR